MKSGKRTILVTGATGGIGTKVCSLLALGGATLVLNGQHASKLNLFKTGLPGKHHVVAADLCEAAGRRAVVRACEEAGGIDALINLAGILDFGLYGEQDAGMIERLMQVNVLAPMLLVRELLPQLLARSAARIVNVGSTHGSVGHPGFVAYGASKAALRNFSEALARELADTRVSVAYISPRTTLTGLNAERVMELHLALGGECDSPVLVAAEIVAMLDSTEHERLLGWSEKFFMRCNALMPSLVSAALARRLPLIKLYAHKD